MVTLFLKKRKETDFGILIYFIKKNMPYLYEILFFTGKRKLSNLKNKVAVQSNLAIRQMFLFKIPDIQT